MRLTLATGAAPRAPRLRRALSLRDLITYGVIVISPMAPMTFFGILTQRGQGHAATTILIAMFAMLLTAVSYGRMALAYPSAGSGFTYVGREISPAWGYVTGWSMVLDYLVQPIINVIFCSQQSHVLMPIIPYWGWALAFTALFTGLNLQGIKMSARFNTLLAMGMGLVVVLFFAAAARYVAHHPHGKGFFMAPFYDSHSWTTPGILSATSLAVLAYLGFDGISTLSEEARNPRDVLPATVLTCVAIGLLSVLEVYAAQLIWPVSEPFPDLDTAFTSVAGRAWAPLYGAVGIALIVACVGSGTGMQLGAARLLFGMGRGGALPAAFFGAVEPKRSIPRNSVLFVGGIALVGALLLPAIAGEATGFDLGASLLNFGALISFMGVNAAAFVRFYVRAPKKQLFNLAAPLTGFVICLLLWWNLSRQAWVLGAVWMVVGIGIGAWKTRGFRENLVSFELAPDLAANALET